MLVEKKNVVKFCLRTKWMMSLAELPFFIHAWFRQVFMNNFQAILSLVSSLLIFHSSNSFTSCFSKPSFT